MDARLGKLAIFAGFGLSLVISLFSVLSGVIGINLPYALFRLVSLLSLLATLAIVAGFLWLFLSEGKFVNLIIAGFLAIGLLTYIPSIVETITDTTGFTLSTISSYALSFANLAHLSWLIKAGLSYSPSTTFIMIGCICEGAIGVRFISTNFLSIANLISLLFFTLGALRDISHQS